MDLEEDLADFMKHWREQQAWALKNHHKTWAPKSSLPKLPIPSKYKVHILKEGISGSCQSCFRPRFGYVKRALIEDGKNKICLNVCQECETNITDDIFLHYLKRRAGNEKLRRKQNKKRGRKTSQVRSRAHQTIMDQLRTTTLKFSTNLSDYYATSYIARSGPF